VNAQLKMKPSNSLHPGASNAETNETPLHGEGGSRVLARTSHYLEKLSHAVPTTFDQASESELCVAADDTWASVSKSDDLREEVGNVIRFSAPRVHPERPLISIVAVQEWEGVVDEITGEYFRATLVDVSADAYRPTETMDIPLTLIDDEDKGILQPGVIFRLVIGRERRRGGQIQNKTLVYIRRNKFYKAPEPQEVSFGDLFREWT
jgi:hypothetical protein